MLAEHHGGKSRRTSILQPCKDAICASVGRVRSKPDQSVRNDAIAGFNPDEVLARTTAGLPRRGLAYFWETEQYRSRATTY
jgi:hypothetical protein